MSGLEQQMEASLQIAELELSALSQQAEDTMEKAITAQEAVVGAGQNIERLRAALAALRGEVPSPNQAAPAPVQAPATPAPAGQVAQPDLAPPRIGAPVDPNDPLANRSADFGEAPAIMQADSMGNVINAPVSEGYQTAPQPQLVTAAGQPVRKRRDDPAALAASQQKGPQCKSCGKYGTMAQYQKYVGDRGPFIFTGCTECGSERMIG